MKNEQTLNKIASAVFTIQADLTGVKADLAGVKTDLSSVKDDLSGVKTDLASVKDDLSGVKTDLASVKDDLSGVKTDLTGVKEKLNSVAGDLQGTKIILSRVEAVAVDTRETMREKMVTQDTFVEAKSDIITHIDGFIHLHQKVEQEIVALSSKYQRLAPVE